MPTVFVITTHATSRGSDSYDDLDDIVGQDAYTTKARALKVLRKLVLEQLEENELDDAVDWKHGVEEASGPAGGVTLHGKTRGQIEWLDGDELEEFATSLDPEPLSILELELEG